jgi:hypothetical protein
MSDDGQRQFIYISNHDVRPSTIFFSSIIINLILQSNHPGFSHSYTLPQHLQTNKPNQTKPQKPTINMYAATAIVALFAAVAAAAPTVQERQAYVPCSGIYGSAVCCATDVLGVADLNCNSPTTSPPASAAAFQSDCATNGLSARCCAIPLVRFLSAFFMAASSQSGIHQLTVQSQQLGQGVLCETPAGINEGSSD